MTKTLLLNNLKTRIAVNDKMSVFDCIICMTAPSRPLKESLASYCPNCLARVSCFSLSKTIHNSSSK